MTTGIARTPLYAIMHVPTQTLLPIPATDRSATATKLDDPRPPRLFRTRTGASNALRHWLAGEQSIEHGTDQMTGDDWHITHIKPMPDRIASDMLVVEVSINIHTFPTS